MDESQALPALVCALLVTLLMALVPVPAPVRESPSGRKRRESRRRASAPAEPHPQHTPDAATLLDFTAAMLRAGVGIEAALHRLSQDVPGCAPLARVHRGLTAGQRWQQAWSCVESQTQLRDFGEELAFAHATGAPTVELLELTAVQSRRRGRQAVEEQAARLAVKMVLPLGLCFLPGFILLGVIPVVLGLVEKLA